DSSEDEQPETAEDDVGHRHHEENAVVVSPAFPQWIVVLRTGGASERFLSGRACLGHVGNDKERERNQQEHEKKPGRFWHVHSAIVPTPPATGRDDTASSRRSRR